MSLLWIAVSVVLYALMSCQSALALEFTADQVIKIDGKTRKAYIYYRDAMWRIEHHTMGPVNVSIVRKDKQVVWLLLSRMKHFKTPPSRRSLMTVVERPVKSPSDGSRLAR